MNKEINLIELLLNADLTKKETDKVEIKRLSKKLGVKFEIELKAMNVERYYELHDSDISATTNGAKLNQSMRYNNCLNTICECIVTPNFNDDKLKEKLGLPKTALIKDVLSKLFTASNIVKMDDKVAELSGVLDDNDEIDKIKN